MYHRSHLVTFCAARDTLGQLKLHLEHEGARPLPPASGGAHNDVSLQEAQLGAVRQQPVQRQRCEFALAKQDAGPGAIAPPLEWRDFVLHHVLPFSNHKSAGCGTLRRVGWRSKGALMNNPGWHNIHYVRGLRCVLDQPKFDALRRSTLQPALTLPEKRIGYHHRAVGKTTRSCLVVLHLVVISQHSRPLPSAELGQAGS